jgi:hypothetical protein
MAIVAVVAEQRIYLDTSKESSHTADHDGFCVDAQTSGLWWRRTGAAERTGAATTKLCALRLATQQLGHGGTARVQQASAKDGFNFPSHRP